MNNQESCDLELCRNSEKCIKETIIPLSVFIMASLCLIKKGHYKMVCPQSFSRSLILHRQDKWHLLLMTQINKHCDTPRLNYCIGNKNNCTVCIRFSVSKRNYISAKVMSQ